MCAAFPAAPALLHMDANAAAHAFYTPVAHLAVHTQTDAVAFLAHVLLHFVLTQRFGGGKTIIASAAVPALTCCWALLVPRRSRYS